MRTPRWQWLAGAVLTFGALSCAKQQADGTGGGGTTTAATMATVGTGGMSACSMDCSKIQTPACLKSVCNDGSYPGTVGTCAVVNDDGASCDDGKFCTTKDTCMGGQCVGGPENTCGMMSAECSKVACSESTKSCVSAPDASQDGASCASTDLCQTGAVCMAGTCKGTPKDCSFDPGAECNTVACDPSSGMCKVAGPNTSKNGAACSLTGDLCKDGKTCSAGMCVGGTPKDCSSLTQNCVVGQCVASNGQCTAMPIPAGGMCAAASDQCNQGFCDTMGMCKPTPLATGTACNDHNACTSGDTCTAGTCSGTSVTGCALYYTESFETCPAGWALAGDWQCGVPTVVGPPSAENGTKCIGTKISANYSASDTYAMTTATSPPIGLLTATNPQLVFYMWVDTDEFSDGGNLSISTDNGATWSILPTSKPYPYMLGSKQAWAGHESDAADRNLGWQRVTANLQPYVGHSVLLRFAFYSDPFTFGYPGIYVDDMLVAEANAVPLAITTATIPTPFVGHAFSANVARVGGSPNAVWSIAGGTNNAWLSINPMTGTLTGTPTAANLGAGSVHVHVEEPSLPSNFADKTFNFNVGTAIYYENFEGACPSSWTLAGIWNCGTPVPIPTAAGTAPATAFSGSQCLATGIGTGYPDSLDWATNTATSPAISLVGTTSPKLDFMAWLESEVGYDGFNVQISTDGGATYAVATGVTPAYPTTTLGTPLESAWQEFPNGGWKPYEVDLTPYANQSIRVRFAFESDIINHYGGAYIDDVVVH